MICFASGGSKDRRYLVKWRDLPYSECTWEFPDSIPEGLEDWSKHVDAYWTRKYKIHILRLLNLVCDTPFGTTAFSLCLMYASNCKRKRVNNLV